MKPGTVDAITCNVVTLSSSARNRMRPPINSLATRDDRPAVASALAEINANAALFKSLGSYPREVFLPDAAAPKS